MGSNETIYDIISFTPDKKTVSDKEPTQRRENKRKKADNEKDD